MRYSATRICGSLFALAGSSFLNREEVRHTFMLSSLKSESLITKGSQLFFPPYPTAQCRYGENRFFLVAQTLLERMS